MGFSDLCHGKCDSPVNGRKVGLLNKLVGKQVVVRKLGGVGTNNSSSAL